MFFSAGFNFVSSVLAKTLAGKSVSKVTCFMSSQTLNLNQSINQSGENRRLAAYILLDPTPAVVSNLLSVSVCICIFHTVASSHY